MILNAYLSVLCILYVLQMYVPMRHILLYYYYYLRQGGYVFASVSLCVCVSVCVCVCVCVIKITQKVTDQFLPKFEEGS